ncbi:MAG: hypothetical protein Kow0059_13520 [Candidatus Sumerlaeia bacterium]
MAALAGVLAASGLISLLAPGAAPFYVALAAVGAWGLGRWTGRLISAGADGSRDWCAVTCFALGAGELSLLILGLGFLNGYSKGAVLALTVGLAVGALIEAALPRPRFAAGPSDGAGRERRSVGADGGDDRRGWSAADLIAIAPLLLAAGVVLPASLAPSVNYDVLEYHLGAVRDLISAGRYAPCPHNVYAWMPAGAQMLFLAGALLEGDVMGGAPRLIVALCYVGLLWVTVALGRAAGLPRWARLAGAAVVAAHPLPLKLTMNALADLPAAWMTGAAVVAAMDGSCPWNGRFVQGGGVGRRAALAGVLMGLAVWFKLTVLKIFILPFAVFFILPETIARTHLGPKRRRQAGAALLIFLASAGLPLFPHLLKNALLLGNPFYPALSGVFPTPGLWTPEQTQFWARAHGQVAFLGPEHWRNLIEARLVLAPVGLVLAGLGVLLGAVDWRRTRASGGRAGRVVGFIVLSYVLWGDTLQAPDRFLAPLVPMLGLLAAMLLAEGELLAGLLWARLTDAIGGAGRESRSGGRAGRDDRIPDADRRRSESVRRSRGVHEMLRVAAASVVFVFAAPPLFRQAYYFNGLKYYEASLGGLSREGFLYVHLDPGFVEVVEEANRRAVQAAGSRLSSAGSAAVQASAVGKMTAAGGRGDGGARPRLLLLYEARPALFTAPALYNTVHDQSVLLAYARGARSPEEIASRLRADGVRWVLLNERELARLVQFFAPDEALRGRGVERGRFLQEPGLAEQHLDLYEPYWLAPDWAELETLVRGFHDLVRRRAVFSRPVAPGWPWFVILAELP